jgi:hypothetical protein
MNVTDENAAAGCCAHPNPLLTKPKNDMDGGKESCRGLAPSNLN